MSTSHNRFELRVSSAEARQACRDVFSFLGWRILVDTDARLVGKETTPDTRSTRLARVAFSFIDHEHGCQVRMAGSMGPSPVRSHHLDRKMHELKGQVRGRVGAAGSGSVTPDKPRPAPERSARAARSPTATFQPRRYLPSRGSEAPDSLDRRSVVKVSVVAGTVGLALGGLISAVGPTESAKQDVRDSLARQMREAREVTVTETTTRTSTTTTTTTTSAAK